MFCRLALSSEQRQALLESLYGYAMRRRRSLTPARTMSPCCVFFRGSPTLESKQVLVGWLVWLWLRERSIVLTVIDPFRIVGKVERGYQRRLEARLSPFCVLASLAVQARSSRVPSIAPAHLEWARRCLRVSGCRTVFLVRRTGRPSW